MAENKKSFEPFTENKVWCKTRYIDAIISNRFNGLSIQKNLNSLVSTMRNCGWDEEMIYDFLVKEVEPEAKCISYLNSIVGYIYGWTSSIKESFEKLI